MSLHDLIDPSRIIEMLGLLGVIGIVFAESGLFFGFFLPGDSLLFTAGLLASQGYFSIVALLVGSFIAAVLGDSVGYSFGRFVGQSLFERPDSRWFKHRHVDRARIFYEKHGSKAIVFARFIPIVRTFAPIVAGVAKMKYSTFITYNLVGAFIWTFSMSLLGYSLGSIIPDADRFILPIVMVIIVLSFMPIIIPWVKSRLGKKDNI